MENISLKVFLDREIDNLKGILESYANFAMERDEFVTLIWTSSEILAKKFREEKVKLELKEVMLWNSF